MKNNFYFIFLSFFTSLFLYSSVIKQLYVFPIDITLLSFLAVSILYVFLEKNFKVTSPILLLFLFFIMLGVSYYFSKSESVGGYKFIATAPGLIISLYLLTLNYNKYNAKAYLDVFSIMSVPVALYFIYILPKLFSGGAEGVDVVRSIYLSLPLYLCISIVYAVTQIARAKILYGLIVSVNIIAVLMSGARGPLLGLFLCLTILFFANYKTIIREVIYRRFYLLPLVFIVCSYIISTVNIDLYSFFERTIKRFEMLLNDNGGNSVNERLFALQSMYHNGFEDLTAVFLGKGLGTFGIEVYGIDAYYYPHNVFLELAFETGLVTLSVFLLFLASLLYGPKNNQLALLYAIFIFLTFNFMKSYSIVGLRLFIPIFIFSYLLTIYPCFKKEKSND